MFIAYDEKFYYFKFDDFLLSAKKSQLYTHCEVCNISDKNFLGKFLCADFREICVNTKKKIM